MIRQVLPFALLALSARGQIPAPAIEWEPWQPAGTCGGVQYFASITKDDGRNDFQVRLKAANQTGQLLATRFEGTAYADNGKTRYVTGGSRINPGREAMGQSFSFGRMFETPINQPLPVRVVKLVLTVLETANVEKPPAYATDSTYLNDFRDFPKETCGGVTVGFASSPAARFVGLTETCYNQLPKWIPACQQAVDEIIRYYDLASESDKACVVQWRQFQKCYEVYAFGPSPNVVPQCNDKVPHCKVESR